MDKNSVEFKILEEMEQGSKVTVVFHDDTKMTGIVLSKFYVSDSYNEENGCYLVRLQVNGEHETQINSNDIKEIERCTTADAGLITGRAVIEKYDISCNRYMGNIIIEITDKWDDLDDTAKAEIGKVLSASMNQYVMKDMISAMHLCKQYNAELHEKIMKSIEEKKVQAKNVSAFYDKYRGIKKYLTKEYATIIDWILFDYCGLKKALSSNSMNERKDRLTVHNDIIMEEKTNVR